MSEEAHSARESTGRLWLMSERKRLKKKKRKLSSSELGLRSGQALGSYMTGAL